MKKESKIEILKILIGKRALFFALTSLIFSFFLGFSELLNANILLLLMQKLGLGHYELQLNFFGSYQLSLEFILCALVGSAIIKFVIQLMASQTMTYASETINLRLKSLTIYDMLFGLSSNPLGSSDVFFRFNEVIPKMVNGISLYISIISIIIQLLILISTMFISLPKETLLSLAIIFLIGLAALMNSKLIYPLSQSVNLESKNLANQVLRSSRNLAFLKIMRTELREHVSLTNTVKILSQHVINLNFVTIFASSLTPLLGILLISTVIYFSVAIFHTNGLLIISFLYLMMRFIQNLGTLSQLYSQLQSYSAQIATGISYMKSFKDPEVREILNPTGKLNIYGKSKLINFNISPKIESDIIHTGPPRISVENVNFSYGSRPIIRSTSFEILPGESIAICGESGSGKSTLLYLILGLYFPKSGKIEVNNKPAIDFFTNETNRIGYVGAEPYLIKGTILDNLLYGILHEVSDLEIQKVLAEVHLLDLIEDIGLNYEIQEDHSGISAGQKQRICLARALLNKPLLLILDEATANLDSNTEDIIRDSISKLEGLCTIIIVSHRANFIKNIKHTISL